MSQKCPTMSPQQETTACSTINQGSRNLPQWWRPRLGHRAVLCASKPLQVSKLVGTDMNRNINSPLSQTFVKIIWWIDPLFLSKFRGLVVNFPFLDWPSLFCFCYLNFIILFPYLIKYHHIMVIIIVFWLGSDWPSWFVFLSCPFYFFPYSRLSSYLLLFLNLISFLLFPCASVVANTRAWVPHFI